MELKKLISFEPVPGTEVRKLGQSGTERVRLVGKLSDPDAHRLPSSLTFTAKSSTGFPSEGGNRGSLPP